MAEGVTSLTPESTLLYFLRTLFETDCEYAVYIPEAGDVIILSKGQLVSMVERNCADSMIKTLPQLSERNIFRPINPEEIEYPNEIRALYVRNTGSFVNNLETALYPDEIHFPEWWNAPVPFAMCSRGILKLNETAVKMFGTGLEKLNANELPERDEFIVKVDGVNEARLMAFKKLRSGIFTIDDCTDDLNDAQDMTWWAAVGRTWVKEIETQGGKWQRLETPPEGKKTFRACEWQGEIQGYLNIEMPKRKKTQTPKPAKIETQNFEPEQEIKTEPEIKEDIVGSIGPQAMALLAAGQTREENLYDGQI